MKNNRIFIKFYLIALMMSLGFYSCNDPEVEPIKEFPIAVNDNPCSSNECILLTDGMEKEWRLVKIISTHFVEISPSNWSDCEKSETLTFYHNNSFSVSCADLGSSKFLWSIIENNDHKVLDFKSNGNTEVPQLWTDDQIIIHLLTMDNLIIEVNGTIREYIPSDLVDYSMENKK